MNTTIFRICVVALAVSCVACESFLAIDKSPQMIASNDVFADEHTAQSAVNGIYIHMRSASLGLANGGATVYAGLAADEVLPVNEHDTYSPFYRNAIPTDNSVVASQLWGSAYQAIYRCNSIIEQFEQRDEALSARQSSLLGEVKLVRAFHYFYLTQLFGSVPLVLTTDYQQNALMGRSSVEDVMAQVLADLQDARMRLPEPETSAEKTRPGKWAAVALLARVQLFLGDYAGAALMADSVIQSEAYLLETDLENTYQLNSQETIWEIAPRNGTGNNAEAGVFLPPNETAPPLLMLTDGLLGAFDTRDLRLQHWIGILDEETGQIAYAHKYKGQTYGAYQENLVVLRVAEQYLIRSEARLRNDDLAGAREDLNIIRQRAGLPAVFPEADVLLAFIQEERRKELFAEWGHRWSDLKRWGLIDDVMAGAKPDWVTTDALFPIPENQLLYNPNLTQNHGY